MKSIVWLTLFLSSSAFAWGSYTTYDHRTGNTYNVNQGYGTTEVQGNNYATGSSWHTSIQQNGDMNGTDSGGNMWHYSANTHMYQNYGTGVMCTGQGFARICTGG